jgi:hypothetical protein
MEQVPGEPSSNESAVECAIRVIRELQARCREFYELLQHLEWVYCAECEQRFCPVCDALWWKHDSTCALQQRLLAGPYAAVSQQ